MPLAEKSFYTSIEAIELIASVLPQEDPEENLRLLLFDGSVSARVFDEDTGQSIDCDPQWFHLKPDGNKPDNHRFAYDLRNGTAFVLEDNGERVDLDEWLDGRWKSNVKVGVLQIDKSAMDRMLVNFEPVVDNGKKPTPGEKKPKKRVGRSAGTGFAKDDAPYVKMISDELANHPSKRAAAMAVVKEHGSKIRGAGFEAKVDRLCRQVPRG